LDKEVITGIREKEEMNQHTRRVKLSKLMQKKLQKVGGPRNYLVFLRRESDTPSNSDTRVGVKTVKEAQKEMRTYSFASKKRLNMHSFFFEILEF
jgi:hypothetical protein